MNKIAGAIFGAAKVALIVSVILNLFGKMNDTITFVKQETLDETILYNRVKDFAPAIFPSIMEQVESLKENNPFRTDENKTIKDSIK